MATHVVVRKCLGLLVFSANFRKGTSVLLVKGTAHTGMKETCVKTTMITSASSGVGCLKKYPFPTSFFHMMSFFRPCSEINVWTYIFSMPTLIAQGLEVSCKGHYCRGRQLPTNYYRGRHDYQRVGRLSM